MNIIAIIPARMAATRFPGKPLADIHGIPMIGHVFFRAKMAALLHKTYVATCDQEIKNYCDAISAPCVMTADTHERCTDRTAEAMVKIEEQTGQCVDIVVMVQGDEPMTYPQMLEQAVQPLLKDPTINVANLMITITSEQEFNDPNAVKTVVDKNNQALYFSREGMPSRKKWSGTIPMYRQLGLIAFRRDYLLRFNQLAPTPLEQIESVDMLRVLEHGDKVNMVLTEHRALCVDTPQDIERVRKEMINDALMTQYGALV